MTLPPSIGSLPILSQILMLALIIVILVLVYYLMRPWWRQRRQSRLDLRIAIPEFLSVSQRPFIPSSEVALFNLLHLVSRDIFLVFAKIPMRTLVQVNVDDGEVHRELVKTLRSVTADYVFVHPGTMLPNKIVMIESVEQGPEQSNLVSILMKMICQEAEIDIIWLNADRNYSANELSEMLGLREDD